MGYVAIGIVVLVGVLYVAGAILSGMASAADSASKGLSAFVARTLGRKSLGMMASIPEELQESKSPIPKHDPDKAALSAYKPEPPPDENSRTRRVQAAFPVQARHGADAGNRHRPDLRDPRDA
jgi:hypothetical protein